MVEEASKEEKVQGLASVMRVTKVWPTWRRPRWCSWRSPLRVRPFRKWGCPRWPSFSWPVVRGRRAAESRGPRRWRRRHQRRQTSRRWRHRSWRRRTCRGRQPSGWELGNNDSEKIFKFSTEIFSCLQFSWSALEVLDSNESHVAWLLGISSDYFYFFQFEINSSNIKKLKIFTELPQFNKVIVILANLVYRNFSGIRSRRIIWDGQSDELSVGLGHSEQRHQS